MTLSTNGEMQHDQSKRPRPTRSQSSWRWNYFPEERPGHRVRRQRPNAFVAARMGYRAAL